MSYFAVVARFKCEGMYKCSGKFEVPYKCSCIITTTIITVVATLDRYTLPLIYLFFFFWHVPSSVNLFLCLLSG